MKVRQSGFTLVEIAIVLVIIGLLLGGVLKGQELIFNSKVKATFNLTREISAAFNSYMDRYGQLPGDDNAAATRFPAAVPLPLNGNANGVLAFGDCSTNVATTENCESLYHLRLAGFISGSGTSAIHVPFGGPSFPAGGNNVVAGLGTGVVLAFYPNSLTYKAANAIDTSFDDGNSATGLFRCNGGPAYNMSTPDASIGVYCSMSL
jgi:prepilin-type N-terminal cleavage/methylation domain-containing protein